MKPRLTDRVLDGLTEAITRMEADDLTDLEPDRDAAFQAASRWLDEMYAYRGRKKSARAALSDPARENAAEAVQRAYDAAWATMPER